MSGSEQATIRFLRPPAARCQLTLSDYTQNPIVGMGGNAAYIAVVKKGKGSGDKRRPTRSWVNRQFPPGFRGYPIATAAFYGPNDKLATKVVVSVFLTQSDEPDFLQRWFSEGEMDVRDDPTIGEEILTFFKTHAPRSTIVADAIIGCPHEEGKDYPQGTSCPQCPFWAGRDRFTHERIQ